MYNLPKVKELAHYVYFYGKDKSPSPMTRYLSNDRNVIGDQLTQLEIMGIAGLIALTYGPLTSSFIHQSTMIASQESADRDLLFALCFDPWTVRGLPDPTAALIAAINHPDTQMMLNARSYVPEHYILDFNTGADKAKVEAAIPGIKVLQKSIHFAWPNFQKGKTGDQGTFVLSDLKRQFNLATMLIPCVCPQFNDGAIDNPAVQAWDKTQPVRIAESQGGNFSLDQVDAIPATANYLQHVTANDYFERTVMEPEWTRHTRVRIGK